MQTLLRWLVARKWKYEHAKADLAAHTDWRASHVPQGRIGDSEVGRVLVVWTVHT